MLAGIHTRPSPCRRILSTKDVVARLIYFARVASDGVHDKTGREADAI